MTGAISIIGTGTPLQPLVGCLFHLFMLLLVLKLAPYDSIYDDWASFFSLLAIMMTMLLGFALISDDKENPAFPPEHVTFLLMLTNSTAFFINFGIMLYVSLSLKVKKKCIMCMKCKCKRNKSSKKKKKQNKKKKKITQITPTHKSLGRSCNPQPQTLNSFSTSTITRETMLVSDLRPNRVLQETIQLTNDSEEQELKLNSEVKGGRIEEDSAKILFGGSPELQDLQRAVLESPPQWDLVSKLLEAYPNVAKEWVPIVQDKDQNDLCGGHLLLHLTLECNAPISVLTTLLDMYPEAVSEPTKLLCSKNLQDRGNESPIDIALRCNTPEIFTTKLKKLQKKLHEQKNKRNKKKSGINVKLVRGIEDKVSRAKTLRLLKKRATQKDKRKRRSKFSGATIKKNNSIEKVIVPKSKTEELEKVNSIDNKLNDLLDGMQFVGLLDENDDEHDFTAESAGYGSNLLKTVHINKKHVTK